MAVANYGALGPEDVRRQSQRRGAAAQLAVAAAVVGALVVACMLVARAQHPAPTALLGFDPFNSNSQPGKSSVSTLGAFEQDSEEREPLPSWATEWSDEGHNSCLPGAQCDHGNMPNPLGSLGRWVMIKTSPHFNSKYDYYRRHQCANLPGWALEECHRMRDTEHNLDEEGNPKDGSEAKAVPMMLHEYRMQPAMRRALPARWQHMRRSHLELARQAGH
jgi:hypothetical protein